MTLAAVAIGCLAEQLSIHVARIDGADIRIDGRLDEPAWTQTPAVTLVQQSPHPSGTTPYTTTMRVIADHDKLYFGFTCNDPEPKKIAIHTMQRDGDMYGDDSVAIVLDTFGDQRSGYYFRVNAAGAHGGDALPPGRDMQDGER
jgi:cellulose/xylan binding protein with CBM9 domain